jgi:hypothetical protein
MTADLVAGTLERYATLQALLKALDDSAHGVHLGAQEAKDAAQHFLLRLTEGPQGSIGVSTRIAGTVPGWIRLDAGLVLVGYDDRFSAIDLGSFRLAFTDELLSIFFEFMCEDGIPIILCETAVIGLSAHGRVAWRRDTDVIVDHTVDHGVLEITQMDGPRLRLDLRSGGTSEILA